MVKIIRYFELCVYYIYMLTNVLPDKINPDTDSSKANKVVWYLWISYR